MSDHYSIQVMHFLKSRDFQTKEAADMVMGIVLGLQLAFGYPEYAQAALRTLSAGWGNFQVAAIDDLVATIPIEAVS